jgi:small subunit ribosomal protein S1
MGALLEESANYTTASRGAIVEGVVMGWDREGVFVDIGSKTEGIVPRSEMHSLGAEPERSLQSGDKVLVFIVQPETMEGQILLSIDRARGERGWRVLQELHDSADSFEAQVTGFNKGGLLVNYEGVNAFVPLSQLVGVRPDRESDDGSNALSENVGRNLRLKVIEINRRRNRVILSERAALQEWRSQQKERLIEELREGDIRSGRISSVRNFGVFVDLGGADGLAHLSELTWERDKSPSDLFKVGDEVNVYVTKVDHENKKIALSLRRANPGKWDEIVDKYKEGQVVPGLITKLVTFGAFAKIEGPIEGLVHVSELVDKRINHPKEVVREGDLVPLKVVRIERDRHRLGLSLRRAREDGERMGFVFSDIGEVIQVPADIRSEFEEREGPIPAPAEPRPEVEPRAAAPEGEEPAAEAVTEALAEAAPERERPPQQVAPPREPDPPSATMVLTPEQAQAIVGAVATDDSESEAAVTPDGTEAVDAEASEEAAEDDAEGPARTASDESTAAEAEVASASEPVPEDLAESLVAEASQNGSEENVAAKGDALPPENEAMASEDESSDSEAAEKAEQEPAQLS